MSRRFNLRAPRNDRELQNFYRDVIDKLKDTPMDLSDLEMMFWFLHEDKNPDVRRVESDVEALSKLFHATPHHNSHEVEKAIQAAMLMFESGSHNEDTKQALQDERVLSLMGV